ncbi:putative tuliposide A-converting enzyme b6, amyloplastic [Cocos nucifera]|uniref:Putative tuliposide A-converting enzyme b6, amyloplastic n=1 Tax=Cocos nucifera TaxID=13894 RepID=A0A8K0N179_COCNU|nr:putative tuliposide A-converting enzyme b6, amyloplastic [Cocos nucifera]
MPPNDVTINPSASISIRIYLSTNTTINNKKLCIFIYIHSYYFVIESTFSTIYHHYLSALAA